MRLLTENYPNIRVSNMKKNCFVSFLLSLLLATPLTGCSRGTNDVLKEAKEVSNFSLSQECVSISKTCTADISSKGYENSTISYDFYTIFTQNDGRCVGQQKSNNNSEYTTYYIEGWSFLYSAKDDSYQGPSYTDIDVFKDLSLMKNVNENRANNTASKVVNKEEITYSCYIKDCKELFYTTTNHRYDPETSTNFSFPKSINIKLTTINGLIVHEEASYSFDYFSGSIKMTISLNYDYSSKSSLPSCMEECVALAKDNNSFKELKKDFVKEISYEHQGEKPPLADNYPIDETGKTQYFKITECTYTSLCFDGTEYFVRLDHTVTPIPNYLFVYSATSMELLYTAIFHRPVNSFYVCKDGKIAVRLMLDIFTTGFMIYSLDDFSFIEACSCRDLLIAGNKIYYQQFNGTNWILYSHILKSDTSTILATTEGSNATSDDRYFIYLFKEDLDIFFAYFLDSDLVTHCYGYSIKNDQKLYEKTHSDMVSTINFYYSASLFFEVENGMTSYSTLKTIGFQTGEIVTKQEYSYDYVFTGRFASYEARYSYKLNEKYDFVRIWRVNHIDEHTVEILDETSYVYDKERDLFSYNVLTNGIDKKCYIVQQTYFIGHYSSEVVLINLQ